MPDYSTRPLDAGTWPDFADLVEAHNGVWGGCWCMAFHPEGVGRGKSPAQNRAEPATPAGRVASDHRVPWSRFLLVEASTGESPSSFRDADWR